MNRIGNKSIERCCDREKGTEEDNVSGERVQKKQRKVGARKRGGRERKGDKTEGERRGQA